MPRGAELIVIVTHGRRGIGRMVLGSDAEQMLRQAPVPVPLIRLLPDEATSSHVLNPDTPERTTP